MTSDRTRYGAVVLYFRHGPSVINTLEALREQTRAPISVVVVDNASGDGVLKRLKSDGRLGPEVTVHECASNGGYSAGMNAGLQQLAQSDLDYVLFLTHEVRLAPTAAEELLRVATVQAAAIVGPTLFLGDGTAWSRGGELGRRGQTKHDTSFSEHDFRRATWLDGACLLIAQDALANYGTFDESYFLYWEDVEISTRLAASGPVLCSTRARAEQGTNSAPIYFNTRNRLKYWRERRQWVTLLASVVEALVRMIVRDSFAPNNALRVQARALGIVDGLRREGEMRTLFVRDV
ncbi:glycosyltransferase [Nocardioides terrigena]|uniref:glycosyltransferase n=1 Tax=Nocardioides terrigena TaxID=424797 RepID=UPI00131EEDF2|nr:glycosyltransferase family 2 protein [Nocardioides terrigena]